MSSIAYILNLESLQTFIRDLLFLFWGDFVYSPEMQDILTGLSGLYIISEFELMKLAFGGAFVGCIIGILLGYKMHREELS